MAALLLLLALAAPARAQVEGQPGAQDLDARAQAPEVWQYPAALAAGGLMNVTLQLSTRFLLDVDWALIDSGDGLSPTGPRRWTWDDNEFATNELGHPYQGAFFYSAARVHDLSYLEAVPVVGLASWHWEWFHETEQPSINDQVTTTWSGPLFGEVLWRLSSQVLDESATGGRRAWRELAAGLISPVRGFDRLLRGRAWHRGPPTLAAPMHHDLAVGMENTWARDELVLHGARIHYDLRYGDAFARSSLRRPLDVFDLQVDVGTGRIRGGPGVGLRVVGGLAGRRLDGPGSSEAFLGLFQGAEFRSTPISSVGTSSLGPGFWTRWAPGPAWELDLRGTALGVLMGAIDSPYALEEADRGYVMGPGAEGSLGLLVHRHPGGHVFTEARSTWVRSPVAPVGDEVASLVRGGFGADLWRGWGLGCELSGEVRAGRYDEHPDTDDAYLSLMTHITRGF